MKNTSRDKALQELKVSRPSRLLDFLMEKQVRKSRNAIKSLLSHKQIKINGKLITQHDYELSPGDRVSVMKFDQSRKERKLKGMKIVFEDDELIVVDKDYGLLSVSTDREKLQTAYSVLNEYVKKKSKTARVFVLHRLDREVSGLLVFSKTSETQQIFQKNWHSVVKQYTYTAVLDGKPEPAKGTIVSWLTEDKNYVMRSSFTDNGGLRSVTHYQVIKNNGRYSLVEFDPETRRKNQIRVQMQQIGCPVVGDKKYGSKTNPIKRVAMHAQVLTMVYPLTGELLEFKTNLPKLMQQLLKPQKPQNPQILKTPL